jgi:hypothetical protein
MRAMLKETEIPEWLSKELYQPIPANAPQTAVNEAGDYARGRHRTPTLDNEGLMQEINKIIGGYAKASRRPLTTLADVQAYLEEQEQERINELRKRHLDASAAVT